MMNDIDTPPTRAHMVLIEPDQIEAGNDGIAFVDLRVTNLSDNTAEGVISIYHALIPDFVAALLQEYGALLSERNGPK
jgi:hypothetical protein